MRWLQENTVPEEGHVVEAREVTERMARLGYSSRAVLRELARLSHEQQFQDSEELGFKFRYLRPVEAKFTVGGRRLPTRLHHVRLKEGA